jgi:hypothetical protein
MKAVAIGLAAVAAVVLYKYMSTAAAPPQPYYYPPQQAPARHWYDTALGFLGTVGGTFLGTYAGISNRTRSTPTPGKSASGGTVNYMTGSANTTFTQSDADRLKAGIQ